MSYNNVNIADILTDHKLNDINNWKKATPTQCTIYLTGLLNKQENPENIDYTLHPVGEKHGFSFTIGNGELLQYGPGRKYQRFWLKTPNYGLPCGELGCIRQEDGSAFGADIFKKYIKTYTNYWRSATFKLNPINTQNPYDFADEFVYPPYYAVLPWTRVLYTAPANYDYYVFVCPPEWRSIHVTGRTSWYLVIRTPFQELFLNQNPNIPDVIVIPTPAGCPLENVFNTDYFVAYAQYYDLETFSKMFDMRSFPGLTRNMPEFSITMPAPLFTSENVFNTDKTPTEVSKSTVNDYAKHCFRKDDQYENIAYAAEWNWKYGGEKQTGYKMLIHLSIGDCAQSDLSVPKEFVGITESSFDDPQFMSKLETLKNKPLNPEYNRCSLKREWEKANGSTTFYVNIKNEFDAIVLCACYTTNIGILDKNLHKVFHNYDAPVPLIQAIQDAEKMSGARKKEEDAFWAKAYGNKKTSYDGVHGAEIGAFYKSLYGM